METMRCKIDLLIFKKSIFSSRVNEIDTSFTMTSAKPLNYSRKFDDISSLSLHIILFSSANLNPSKFT